MASREEKLSAARKKLREFQEKSRDSDGQSHRMGSYSRDPSCTSSPSPKFYQQDVSEARPESPLDAGRLAWERRQTLEISGTQLADSLQKQEENRRRQSEANAIVESDERERHVQIDLQQMREQLQRQGQAITVLVAERTDAQTALSIVQNELQQKSDALEDIKKKYLEATQRLSELESLHPDQTMSTIQSVQLEEELRQALESADYAKSVLRDQLSELRSRLDSKNSECQALALQVNTLENALSVAQVKIRQLSTEENPESYSREKDLEEANVGLQRQIELLERRLQAAAMEGEQSAHRFQVYAEQCTYQQKTFSEQVGKINEEKKTLKEQCEALQQQLDSFKSQMNQTRDLAEVPLQGRIDELAMENATLRKYLHEKELEIKSTREGLVNSEESLSVVVPELEALRGKVRTLEATAIGGRPDPALLAAMESDKVAASRAVAQNQKLKSQLTELQEAFVRLSDEKLSLTEELSYAEHQVLELRKQIASHSHLNDPSRGCDDEHESDDEEASWDEAMLRRVVAALRRDKTELVTRLQQLQLVVNSQRPSSHAHSHSHSHDHPGETCEEHEHNEGNSDEKTSEELAELRRAIEQLQADKAELLKRLGGSSDDPQVQGLLETKLRRTMDEIAVLDEEKQRLEHLVLQLQGETETIGEYIALYHKQRLLLRQRSVEKDEQLVQLSKDREELKEKLLSLNELVAKLVGGDSKSEIQGASDERLEDMTAQKIRSLITEIGNNRVVNSHSVAFEQCACCSGRLLTV